MLNSVGYAAWAFVAGGSIPIMAILNARAARILGGTGPATILLVLISLVTTIVAAAILRLPLPRLQLIQTMPVSLYFGGIIVALYIMSVTSLAPRFGVANTVLFVVCAQIAVAAVIDAWGLFGAAIRPMTVIRIIGIGIAMLGVFLSQIEALGLTSTR